MKLGKFPSTKILMSIIGLVLSVWLFYDFHRMPKKYPEISVAEKYVTLENAFSYYDVMKNIEIRNMGNDDLVIEKVEPSCGCTNYSLSTKRIFPSHATVLSVTFGILDEFSDNIFSIKIFSNDPHNPVAKLTIIAKIQHNFLITPDSFFHFGKVPVYRGQEKTLFFSKADGSDFEIMSVSLNKDEFYARVEGKDCNVVPLIVGVKPQQRKQYLFDVLTIVTNDKKQPILKVPVVADIQGLVTIHPNPLFLGRIKKGQPVKKIVKITHNNQNGNTDFKITGFTSINDNDIQISQIEESQYMLTIPAFMKTGFIQQIAKLKTNLKEDPIIDIPISALVVN